MSFNWIPAADDLFEAFFLNFATLISTTPTDYGLVSGDGVAILASYNDWNAAYVLTLPREHNHVSSTLTAAKNAQRTLSEQVIRQYGATIRANPAVDDVLKLGIGLTVNAFAPTPIPAPASACDLAVVSIGHDGVHDLSAQNPDTPTTKAKPYGSVAVRVYRTVGVARAASPAGSVFVGDFTKSPFRVINDVEDAGKVATYFGKYVTATDLTGPFGESAAAAISI